MRTYSGLARLLALCLSALALSGVRAAALDYPNKPVRFIVCFAAGGPNDITARLFSQYLSDHFGQQFIVENRPGAGGNIGMQSALASPPDGYTIVFVGPNNFINPSIYANMPFDFIRDSAPVAGTMKMTNILVVNPEFHIKTLPQYIAYAKANPGKLNFGSGGVGTSPHMSGELLKAMAGIDIVHVPYRGTAPALVDVLGGQLHSAFDNLPGPIGHVKSGKLRALAVTGAERSPQLPDLPTIAEAGLAGYSVTVWFGLLAPAATPPVIISRINGEIIKSLKTSQMKERLAALGADPVGNTPDQFAAFLKTEMSKWAKVVKAAGIRGE